jgi:hypothetical protein
MRSTTPNTICVGRNKLPLRFGIRELSSLLVTLLGIGWACCAQAGGVVMNCTEANLRSALLGGGTVTFACDGTVTLTSTLTVYQNTVLDGSGHNVVLSGGSEVRIFNVNLGVQLTLVNLVLANGRHVGSNAVSSPALNLPGEPAFGGAIYNSAGVVTLLGCVITNNSVRGGEGDYAGYEAGAGNGGAVFNSAGVLNVTNSLFKGNYAQGGTFNGSSSALGGAINNVNGKVHLVNCTLDGNVVFADASGPAGGGAVWNSGSNTSRLVVVNSTFSSNRVEGGFYGGGAIDCGDAGAYGNTYGDLDVVNTTFCANSGAAIVLRRGSLRATNCTFTDNTYRALSCFDPCYVRNCVFTRTVYGQNISGNLFYFTDGGYNLSDDNSVPLTAPGSLYGIDAKLGSLADNGGPTKTVALLEGSPAIDAGDDATCPTTDQRGELRPVGIHCDIGAFEGSLPVPSFSQAFVPEQIVEGGTARLEFTLQNTSSVSFDVWFSGALPSQIRIAPEPAVTNGCGGNVIASPDGGFITLQGAALGPDQTCTVGISVASTVHGIWTNRPFALWSDKTGLGSSNNPAVLTVVSSPIVTSSRVTSIESNSAWLEAVVDPAGMPTTVYFQHGASTNLGNVTEPVAAGGGFAAVTLSAYIDGLASDAPYHFRVMASNALGTSYGAVSSFRTHGAPLDGYWCDQAALLAFLRRTNIVTFACDGTVVFTNTLIIERDTTLDGNGRDIVLSGGNAVQLFKVNPGVRLTLIGLTIADGRSSGTNGVAYNESGGAAFGGAIVNEGGILTVVNCVLSNNWVRGGKGAPDGGPGGTAEGGAIFNAAGTLIISNCLLVGNATIGGAGGDTTVHDSDRRGGDGLGGVVASKGGMVHLAHLIFLTNSAVGGRGGLYTPVFPHIVDTGPGGTGFGGAIRISDGTANISQCTFVGNRTSLGYSGDAVFTIVVSEGAGFGGAISASNSTMICAQTAFITNQAGSGGALHMDGAIELSDCALAENKAFGAAAQGGAIRNLRELSISRCSLVRNVAQGAPGPSRWLYYVGTGTDAAGGAIWNSGVLRVTNTILHANRAQGGDGTAVVVIPVGLLPGISGAASGGALFNAGGAVNLVHITAAENTAILGTGTPPTTVPVQGGTIHCTNGTVALWNSIVANSPSGSNCFGTLIDGGHNLSSDGSCRFTAPGSLNNTDPLLGPLGDYGGPTPTVPLLVGSPALDAANAAYCPPTDQRGVVRPYGTACDIGAFEWMPYLPNAFAVEPVGPGVTRLVFAGAPNQTYQLLVSTNLPTWWPLTTIMTDANGLFQYVATNDDTRICLFFKAAKP